VRHYSTPPRRNKIRRPPSTTTWAVRQREPDRAPNCSTIAARGGVGLLGDFALSVPEVCPSRSYINQSEPTRETDTPPTKLRFYRRSP
jgi:hypothetical protein